jgi:hypothetical protein
MKHLKQSCPSALLTGISASTGPFGKVGLPRESPNEEFHDGRGPDGRPFRPPATPAVFRPQGAKSIIGMSETAARVAWVFGMIAKRHSRPANASFRSPTEFEFQNLEQAG